MGPIVDGLWVIAKRSRNRRTHFQRRWKPRCGENQAESTIRTRVDRSRCVSVNQGTATMVRTNGRCKNESLNSFVGMWLATYAIISRA